MMANPLHLNAVIVSGCLPMLMTKCSNQQSNQLKDNSLEYRKYVTVPVVLGDCANLELL